MITVLAYRVGQELPSIALRWESAAEIAEALASGWTGRVDFSSIDYPDVKVGVGLTTVTLEDVDPADDADPNFTITLSTTVWADLVTAWARTLPSAGHLFRLWPQLTSGSSNYPWPESNVIFVRLRPALT